MSHPRIPCLRRKAVAAISGVTKNEYRMAYDATISTVVFSPNDPFVTQYDNLVRTVRSVLSYLLNHFKVERRNSSTPIAGCQSGAPTITLDHGRESLL